MRFLHLGGAMVWSGLIVIVLSGIIIFSTDPAYYLESPKFLAKMTIVGIIVANGIVFHLVHIPRLRRHIGAHFPSSDEFIRKSTLLIASGAVSVTSWISALILGSLRYVPYTYPDILLVYFGVLGAAVIGAVIFRKPILGF